MVSTTKSISTSWSERQLGMVGDSSWGCMVLPSASAHLTKITQINPLWGNTRELSNGILAVTMVSMQRIYSPEQGSSHS